jgi:hypothetical protein
VSESTLYFVTAMGLFLFALLSIAAYWALQSRKRQLRWEDLVAGLARVDRDSITAIALDLVDEFGRPKSSEIAGQMEASEIWHRIGGLEGLAAMERNCELLIDLAFYVQQWYPEAVVVAEHLRLDGRQLKWHISRLHRAAANGNLYVSFPFYAQRAVVSYYLILRRVQWLCETGNVSMLADLQKAL